MVLIYVKTRDANGGYKPYGGTAAEQPERRSPSASAVGVISAAPTSPSPPAEARRRRGELHCATTPRQAGDADAGNLLDGMPPGSEAASSKKADAAGGADPFGVLPDEVLQHLLSFLPSTDAVRTSVLASRWRHQWKSVPALRITDARRYTSASHLNRFVNRLLRLRKPLPLHEVEIGTYSGNDSAGAFRYIEQWVKHGLSHGAEVLRVRNNKGVRWQLPDGVITSEHLRVLELSNVNLDVLCLDFSSCPALKVLRLRDCNIEVGKVMSLSVQHLSITNCHFNWNDRTQITFPSLTWLELSDCYGCTPLLHHMPLLISAFVRLQTCDDCCDNKYEIGDCGNCYECRHKNIGDSVVLLEGLSGSMNLELTSHTTEYIFRRDLMRCPVFSKLRTLLINEWCLTANLGALTCFLQHCPILEKLILQFPESHEDLVETGASYDTTKEHFTLEQLTVQVKCHKVDEKIGRILTLLASFGVPSDQIEILPPPVLIELEDGHHIWPTGRHPCFTFEQKKA
ncbi:hypothetical protein ACP70R_009652 [Stipagrostis hirtigluma subsp. patula]